MYAPIDTIWLGSWEREICSLSTVYTTFQTIHYHTSPSAPCQNLSTSSSGRGLCFFSSGEPLTCFVMSFSFGFNGDDIEDDENPEEQDALVGQISDYTISDAEGKHTATLPPQRHSLEELVGPPIFPHEGLVFYPLAAVQGCRRVRYQAPLA